MCVCGEEGINARMRTKCLTRHHRMARNEDQNGPLSSPPPTPRSRNGSLADSGRRRVQRMLEKSKASLSRSKSELGEQHRRVAAHLSRGHKELSEQNRKLLANISSRGKRLLRNPSKKNFRSSTESLDQDDDDGGFSPPRPSSAASPALVSAHRTHSAPTKSSTPSPSLVPRSAATVRRAPISTSAPSDSSSDVLLDLDSMLLDLGIDPNFGSPTAENDIEGTGTIRPARPHTGSQRLSPRPVRQNRESSQLERRLEEGYGEFDFIDDRDTLIRDNRSKFNEDHIFKNNDFYNDTNNDLASQIFSELRRSNLQLNNGHHADNEENIYPYGSLALRHHRGGHRGRRGDGRRLLMGSQMDLGRPLAVSPNLSNHVSSFYATTVRKSNNRKKRERRLSSTSFAAGENLNDCPERYTPTPSRESAQRRERIFCTPFFVQCSRVCMKATPTYFMRPVFAFRSPSSIVERTLFYILIISFCRTLLQYIDEELRSR